MTEESTTLSTNLYEQEFSLEKIEIGTVPELFIKIRDVMAKTRVCGNKNNTLRKLNIRAIEHILKVDFNSLPGMKAIECMFDDKNFQSQLSRGIGSNINPMKQWLKKGKNISNGTYGFTFMAELESIKFVGKLSLDDTPNGFVDSVIEYFIGAAVINNFRRFCPNFCYTLGAFECYFNPLSPYPKEICSHAGTSKKFFTFYEHIDGELLANIESPQMFLVMFVQLLLALELAQRENRFFHNDFSMSNIMVTNEVKKFSIVLDTNTFTFNSKVAKIIDYGLSSTTVNEMPLSTVLGKKGDAFTNVYNRTSFLLPGIDMVSILTHAIISCNNQEVKGIARFMMQAFIGDMDPYKVWTMSTENLMTQYKTDYFGKFATSRVAAVTPQQLLTTILGNKDMLNLLAPYVTIDNRNASPIPISVYAYYRDIYGTDFKTDMSCVRDIDSYILGVEVLNSAAVSRISSPELENLKKKMKSDEDAMIQVDMRMLEYFFTIDITEEYINTQLLPMINRILNMRYKDPKDETEVIDKPLLMKFSMLVGFMDILEKYNSIFVKLRMLNIQHDLYGAMYARFTKSLQYYLYDKYGSFIRAALRWSKSLYTATGGTAFGYV